MPIHPLDLALDHYSDRQSLVTAAGEVAGQMWADVDPARIADSWVAQIPELAVITAGAQLGAARQADAYTTEILDAQDVDSEAVAQVDPSGFSGQASDARGLASLLVNPVIVALLSIQDGMDVARALGMGRANLDMLVRTQVADAGRLADQAALTARLRATGYIRMAVGGSCARCLLLSGREYRYNAGFQRHPRCDCIGIPKGDARVPGIRSPEARYADMTPRERTKAGFTKADQLALAEGSDLGQVVNARRGMYTAGGRRYTREGTTKRGLFGAVPENRGRQRLSVDQIFQDAVDRDHAIRLLQQNRYLLTPARVPAPGTAPAGLTGPQKRAAARVRQAEIDRRGKLADLLAELDSLVAKKADQAVFRQRLALGATDGIDPAVLAKLARPIASGNTTALRAAITRAGKAEGLTPIGKAGDAARFDGELHDALGEAPAAGASVIVVRRGTVLDLDGEQIPLSRAQVSTVGAPAKAPAAKKTPAKKAAKKAAPKKAPAALTAEKMTIKALKDLANEHGIRLWSGIRKPEIIAHIRQWESGHSKSILPGSAEAKAARIAAAAAKRAAEDARQAALAADRARIAARAGGLTGEGGQDWWIRLSRDTGPDNPVPVVDYVTDHGRADGENFLYTIKAGRAYRIDGVVYIIEDMDGPHDPRAILDSLRAVHATLPPDTVRHQKAYAWLAGRNPNDVYWQRKFGNPHHTAQASAGFGGTHVWRMDNDSRLPMALIGSLRHEFGHNVSSAVRNRDLHDNGPRWANAARQDANVSVRATIVTLRPEVANGHALQTVPDRQRAFSTGVSKYGQSSAGEDYAESMRLYTAGELGTARLTPGGPVVKFYFRDVWPNRAKLFDELMPEVAREQKAALRRLGR